MIEEQLPFFVKREECLELFPCEFEFLFQEKGISERNLRHIRREGCLIRLKSPCKFEFNSSGRGRVINNSSGRGRVNYQSNFCHSSGRGRVNITISNVCHFSKEGSENINTKQIVKPSG